jgi:hypothetical protein
MVNTSMRVDQVTIEIAPIKLGQTNNARAREFMQELYDYTDEHPFNHRQRILGSTAIEVSAVRTQNRIHLHDILSLEPNKGHATKAIGYLKALANKHIVKIELFAKAYSNSPKHITDTAHLVKWYEKLGFEIDDENYDEEYVDEGVNMLYYPD